MNIPDLSISADQPTAAITRTVLDPAPILTATSFSLDYTTLSDYLKCPRFYLFRHVLGLVRSGVDEDTGQTPLPNRDLHFGSALHTALEFGYEALSLGANLMETIRASITAGALCFSTHPITGEQISWPPPPPRCYTGKTLDNLCVIIEAYWQRYFTADSGGSAYYSEMPFSIAIDDRINYCGRMDEGILYSSGLFRVLEHKSTSMMNAAWIASMRGSLQPEGYLTATRVQHDGPAEIIINGILCSSSKQDFMRLPIARQDHLVDRFLGDLNMHLARLKQDHLILHDFINSPLTSPEITNHNCHLPCMARSGGLGCSAYFRECEYLDFCTLMPNPLELGINPPAGFSIRFWNYEAHVAESAAFSQKIALAVKNTQK